MTERHRMSPLTALFMGIWIVGGLAIVSATAVGLYGLAVVDNKAETLLDFAGDTVDGLPELIEALPPALADILNDRRAPDYVSNISTEVRLVHGSRGGICPALTITNHGDQVVSLLAVHVAALNSDRVPVEEWTQVVATPIAIEDEWRGPLMPRATRHVVLHGCWRPSGHPASDLEPTVEISELRLWRADSDGPALASAGERKAG